MTDPPRRQSSGTGEKDQHTNYKSDNKMAAQSQGIKQLMAAEKEAAQVVANARKSKEIVGCNENWCKLSLGLFKAHREVEVGIVAPLNVRESLDGRLERHLYNFH